MTTSWTQSESIEVLQKKARNLVSATPLRSLRIKQLNAAQSGDVAETSKKLVSTTPPGFTEPGKKAYFCSKCVAFNCLDSCQSQTTIRYWTGTFHKFLPAPTYYSIVKAAVISGRQNVVVVGESEPVQHATFATAVKLMFLLCSVRLFVTPHT